MGEDWGEISRQAFIRGGARLSLEVVLKSWGLHEAIFSF